MDQVIEYDSMISDLSNQIDTIQNETKKKLDSIDRYSKRQLQKFFSDRYEGSPN